MHFLDFVNLAFVLAALRFAAGICEVEDFHAADELTNDSELAGFTILGQLPGIWSGPLDSNTVLPDSPDWIIDFRPISAMEISAKMELDAMNTIHMGIFIAEHCGEYKIVFRNGGLFVNLTRISYMEMIEEQQTEFVSSYTFAEFQIGADRVYTIVEVAKLAPPLELRISTFTDLFGTSPTSVLHFQWEALLVNSDASVEAIQNFQFPQKIVSQDFVDVFVDREESLYYSFTGGGEPYPPAYTQYLGAARIILDIDESDAAVIGSGYTFAIFSVEPFFQTTPIGIRIPNMDAHDTISRYVFLELKGQTFDFDMMHPGTYYLNLFATSTTSLVNMQSLISQILDRIDPDEELLSDVMVEVTSGNVAEVRVGLINFGLTAPPTVSENESVLEETVTVADQQSSYPVRTVLVALFNIVVAITFM